MAKQVAVFIENRDGSLMEVLDILAKNNIDIKILSLADTSEYGMLRMIVNDSIKTKEILMKSNFTSMIVDVIVLEIENNVGELSKALCLLNDNKISIEYMYTVRSDSKATIVMKISDKSKGEELLQKNNYKLLKNNEL